MDDSGDCEVVEEVVKEIPDLSWFRSEDRNANLLHTYVSGEMYDCSFKVGKEPNCKVFRCHKLMLSAMSNVFQAMLFGNFQEARKAPDDPITLSDTTPDAFDASMRFIYGNEKNFNDSAAAIPIYAFAHKMQISSLTVAVSEFLESELLLSNVFAIYDAFRQTGYSEGVAKCKDVLLADTKLALSSNLWLAVSADTVADVLQMDDVSASENSIFQALIAWGKAQLKSEGVEDEGDLQLRAKVDPFLKFIRFESMTSEEAAKMCEMTSILSMEEQRGILFATVLKNLSYLPPGLADAKRNIRIRNFAIQVHYSAGMASASENVKIEDIVFAFRVKRRSKLYAFLLSYPSLFANVPDKEIELHLANHDDNPIGEFKKEDGDKCYRGMGDVLQPGQEYELVFSQSEANEDQTIKLSRYVFGTPEVPQTGNDYIEYAEGETTFLQVYKMFFTKC